MKTISSSEYLQTLKDRGAKRNVTQQFQFLGLEIATILRDMEHKALYIKYAKKYDGDRLLSLAKDVASRKDVKNFGAYFMRIVENELKSRK